LGESQSAIFVTMKPEPRSYEMPVRYFANLDHAVYLEMENHILL
ncbi:1748_t:CDS:1, partial [Funneliformis geosporum]